MILGTASGLPVVACVATKDRWNHMLDCPYCGEVHSHGGHGPTSPAGAVNGGRWSHCGRGGRHGRFEEIESKLYVVMEVPGKASFGRSRDHYWITRHVSYDLDRMPDLAELLAETIAVYEASWAGVNKWTGVQEGHTYPLFRTDGINWPYAYYGRGRVPFGTEPFPDLATPAGQILYRFFGAAGELLYIGITGDAATRWKNHSKKQPWWPLVRRIEIEQFATRAEVEAAEKGAIRAEGPIYNKVHNSAASKRVTKPKENYATDPQHYTDSCHTCFGIWPAVEMAWRTDGVDTLHRCDRGHQWTCSWGKSPFVYEDCECDFCRWALRRKAA